MKGWWYLSPLLLALGVWIYGPAVATVVLSLMDWNLTGPAAGFVGLDNFRRLIDEPEFGRAVVQTLLYALALLPFATVVPLVLAVMLWLRPGRAGHVYRSLLFVPAMMAPVALAVSWRFLLNPLGGLANAALGVAGLPPVNWLGDPATALPVLVAVTAARVVAFNMLLYSAALATLDRRTIEAARLEGARPAEVVTFVVAPQLVRTTVLLGLLSVVLAGQWSFTNVAVLTQGGPDGVTDTIYYRVYTLAFDFFDTGAASAASVLVLAGFAVVAGAAAVLRRRHAT
ncbi:sugar ABC transporter permease [Dactylosporangium sp. AC04546]|uniref:carbohydrate ABC transporter permease n=1 Tax=Dactylosporangium sp. AC04546 TaxID=2862460 RepID=UPI001EDF6B6C|nr:sugar ABC transporter permease [Dactylosporangium sp. AC04546]WVK79097.1 sugar ABC transporter permease [Dactylosporangium sp. AC04546]